MGMEYAFSNNQLKDDIIVPLMTCHDGTTSGTIYNMKNMTPLKREAMTLIDDLTVNVGTDRLALVKLLIERSLTTPIADAFGVTDIEHTRVSRKGNARETMDPNSEPSFSKEDNTQVKTPVYFTMDDTSLGAREIAAANRGENFSTSNISQSIRAVNERVEDSSLNGSSIVSAGGSAPGVVNAPNKATTNFVDSESWTAAGHDGEDILADVIAMFAALEANKRHGPYCLLIPSTYRNELNKDFKANSDKTTLTRLEELVAADEQLLVKAADLLPVDTVVLVQLTEDVIDLAVGMETTTVSWQSLNTWTTFFVAMAIMITRVKDDAEGKSGVCVGTPT